MNAFIERLQELPPGGLDALVAESEQAGLRFVRRLAEECASGVNRFDLPGEALFGARIAGQLVGVGGLNTDPYTTDKRVGRVRHLYVLMAYRQLGIGRRLVDAIMDAARGRYDKLRLHTEDRGAAQFYERLGFHPCAGEEKCTHIIELLPK